MRSAILVIVMLTVDICTVSLAVRVMNMRHTNVVTSKKKNVCSTTIPYSQKREKAWVPGRKAVCKCGHDSVLSRACGVLAGERKFDPSHPDLRGDGCHCQRKSEYIMETPSEPIRYEKSEKHIDYSTVQTMCVTVVPYAVPRDTQWIPGRKKICKCDEGYALSPGCGSLAGRRKFDPRERSLQDLSCQCQAKGSKTSSTTTATTTATLEAASVSNSLLKPQKSFDGGLPREIKKRPKIQITCDTYVPNALPRNMRWAPGRKAACKCAEGSVLSAECGSLVGKRKFDPQEPGLRFGGCNCVAEATAQTTTTSEALGHSKVLAEPSRPLVDYSTVQTLCETSVPDAVPRKRNGRFWNLAKIDVCKCKKDYLLSVACGDLAGLRKFDPTNIDLFRRGCKCEPDGNEQTGFGDANIWGNVEPPTPVQSFEVRCDEVIPNAMKREIHKWSPMQMNVCECPRGFSLASVCGLPKGTRMFNPKNLKLPSTSCSCANDENETKQVISVDIDSDRGSNDVVAPQKMQLFDIPHCSQDVEAPFNFGDYVRIEKQVLDNYLFGVFPRYKHAGISGTIAQVVCPSATKGTRGRVCLRNPYGGGQSAGCWLPKNLVLIDNFVGDWSKLEKGAPNDI